MLPGPFFHWRIVGKSPNSREENSGPRFAHFFNGSGPGPLTKTGGQELEYACRYGFANHISSVTASKSFRNAKPVPGHTARCQLPEIRSRKRAPLTWRCSCIANLRCDTISIDRIGADARAFRSLQVYAAEHCGIGEFGGFDLWETVSLPASRGTRSRCARLLLYWNR